MNSIATRATISFFLSGLLRFLPALLPLFFFIFLMLRPMNRLMGRPSPWAHPDILQIIWIGLAVIIGLILLWSFLAVLCWKFEIDDDKVHIARGVLNRRYTKIPYARIQNVEITRSLFDRLLGLSTLHIHTADSAASFREGRIPGLNRREATGLAEEILRRSNPRPSL